MTNLTGKTIAFLATDGFEDSELTSPWRAVADAGATVTLVAPSGGSIEGKNGHVQSVDTISSEANAGDFDALVLPGGVVNADHLRMDAASVAFAKDFFAQHKPVGAICHAAWILIEAGVVEGRKLTSYASLQTDLRNAGADWVDEEVVVDAGFVTSRTPDDLPAFNAKVIEEIAEGKHADQTA
jgi:protease I